VSGGYPMMKMRNLQFVLRDVRCFAGEHKFNIRPLTFLVGENSTGKSTVLGCMQALADSANQGFNTIDFNAEPHQMGIFEDIARRSKPLNKEFELGMEYTLAGADFSTRLILKEKSQAFEPVISKVSMKFKDARILIELNHARNGRNRSELFKVAKSKGDLIIYWNDARFDLSEVFSIIRRLEIIKPKGELSSAEKDILALFGEGKRWEYRNQPWYRGPLALRDLKLVSIAPIRSKPKRSYDISKEEPTPEGSEIPMALMNLRRSDSGTWHGLKKRLTEFGVTSGLFSDVDIRRTGRSKSDPFQLQLNIRNLAKVNLIDVGYGVSQILPILVRIFRETQPSHFLIQQPEVHLHPKGQAALASLLTEVIEQQKHSFIIETHSDYMIDRARIEIMRGNIKPEDVSLVYFEALKSRRVRPHNIEFDKQGNLRNAPRHYRDFFLHETNNLLGFDLV